MRWATGATTTRPRPTCSRWCGASLQGRKAREIDPALTVLRACVSEAKADQRVSASARKRLAAMLEFTETVDRSFGEIIRLPASTLMALIKMGGAVARLATRGKKSRAKPA